MDALDGLGIACGFVLGKLILKIVSRFMKNRK